MSCSVLVCMYLSGICFTNFYFPESQPFYWDYLFKITCSMLKNISHKVLWFSMRYTRQSGKSLDSLLPWQNDLFFSCQEGVIIKSAKFHRWWVFEWFCSKIELTLLIWHETSCSKKSWSTNKMSTEVIRIYKTNFTYRVILRKPKWASHFGRGEAGQMILT